MVDLDHETRDHITATDVLLVSEDPTLIRKTRELLDLTDKHRFSLADTPHRQAMDQARRIRPDVVILDAHFDDSDPLALLKLIKTDLPDLPLLLLSEASDAILAERTLRAGAGAFVVRASIDHDLLPAIDHLLRRERFTSEEIMQELLRGMMDIPQETGALPVDLLSDREVVVFRFLGQGHTMHEIASELDVHIKTVATHCKNIRKKLHVSSNKNLALAGTRWLESIRKTAPAETKP